MKNIRVILIIILLLASFSNAYTQNISDYLILQDIGSFKFITQSKHPLTKIVKQIPGYSVRSAPGILAGADHFDLDHTDTTYETKYESDIADMGVRVQVTQHSGSDSDKWLLHEVDAEFRNYYGIPDMSYTVKNIEGNTICKFSSGGRDYRWLSGNKVIDIDYTDLMMEKPEPIEIVKAYLTKHPSTIQPMTLAQLRSPENKTKWIKDEMERRLWLCDKWFMALQLGKVQQGDMLEAMVKNMNVFLDYRQKYYGIDATEDKKALSDYLYRNDGTAIRNKLTEYKTWWAANKDKAISL